MHAATMHIWMHRLTLCNVVRHYNTVRMFQFLRTILHDSLYSKKSCEDTLKSFIGIKSDVCPYLEYFTCIDGFVSAVASLVD